MITPRFSQESYIIDSVNQLRVHCEEKKDYQIVQKIIMSIPARFESIVDVMKQTKDLASLSVIKLIGTLQTHKNCVFSWNENTSECAFNAEQEEGILVLN